MKKFSLLSVSMAALLSSPLLLAQVGATTVAPAPTAKAQATDADGDGRLTPSELTPGTRLAQRFEALDLNHDGALTQNEYVAPSASIDHLSGRRNPAMGATGTGSSDVHGNRASN